MQDKRSERGPVFIVGAARSGTTLLQYMLRSHPNLSLPTGESHFFIPLYQRRTELGDLGNVADLRKVLQQVYDSRREFFDTDLHGIRFDVERMVERLHAETRVTIPQVIAGIFEANASGEGKRRWGDKTPYYALHLPALLEMFPNAQVVHLLRDGRDCCLSMLERRKDLGVYNTYHAAYLWSRYVAAAQAFGKQHPGTFFELRYEELLADPVRNVQALCDFLGEPFDPGVVHFKRAGQRGQTPLVSQPLQTHNTEKWRRDMTHSQLRIFESKAGPTLVRNGYKLATGKDPLSEMGRRWQELMLSVYFKLHRYLFR